MEEHPQSIPTTISAVRTSKLVRVARIVLLVSVLIAIGASATMIYLSTPASNASTTNAEDSLAMHGTPINPPRQLADFNLPSQSGTALSLHDLHGKYVLLFFGYTHCPDVCPTTMSDFVQVKRMLSNLSTQVRFVFVSVDGERDTPAVLARFMRNFDADFIGLQGDDRTLNRIGSDYGLYYRKEKVAGTVEPYLVSHSASSYLIDRDGQLRMVYSFGMPPQVMADDIAEMLAKE